MSQVCIVIPCFNEQDRLPFDDYIEFYNKSDHSFCFVNDCSTDGTLDVLYQLQTGRENRITVINLGKNKGKAEAVRNGILYACKMGKFDYIGFLDADLATPLFEIDHLLLFLSEDCHIVMGSRVKRLGAKIIRNSARHYLGRFFATIVSLLFNIGAYDTQCGAKIFSIKIIEKIFTEPFLTKWTFDIEILLRARHIYNKDIPDYIIEVPMNQWIEKGNSRLKFFSMIRMAFDVIKLKFKYNNIPVKSK
jgi:dolichyl-phosphate beta-glucosyltransferase